MGSSERAGFLRWGIAHVLESWAFSACLLPPPHLFCPPLWRLTSVDCLPRLFCPLALVDLGHGRSKGSTVILAPAELFCGHISCWDSLGSANVHPLPGPCSCRAGEGFHLCLVPGCLIPLLPIPSSLLTPLRAVPSLHSCQLHPSERAICIRLDPKAIQTVIDPGLTA